MTNLTERTNKRFYMILLGWTVVASALGIWAYDRWFKEDRTEKLAPLAASRICGQERVQTDKELDALSAKWLVNAANTPRDVQKALLRNLTALPEGASKTFQSLGLKFTTETGKPPYSCLPPESTQAATGLSCVKATLKDGLFAVIGDQQFSAPDGSPANVPIVEQMESAVLPISFWILFQGAWRHDSQKPPRDDEISLANRLMTLKKYVVSGFKLSPGEEDYYHRTFSASGRQSPTFLTRSLVLTASNLYCGKDSYDMLATREPEATRRFFEVYGCTLGKPWFMADKDFEHLCPKTISKN